MEDKTKKLGLRVEHYPSAHAAEKKRGITAKAAIGAGIGVVSLLTASGFGLAEKPFEVPATAAIAPTTANDFLSVATVVVSGWDVRIELYNPTDRAISTKGLFLTNDNDLQKWRMPAVIIEPGESVQVGGSNDRNPQTLLRRMQTNFAIRGWDVIRLTNVGGDVLSSGVCGLCRVPLVERRDSSWWCGLCNDWAGGSGAWYQSVIVPLEGF